LDYPDSLSRRYTLSDPHPAGDSAGYRAGYLYYRNAPDLAVYIDAILMVGPGSTEEGRVKTASYPLHLPYSALYGAAVHVNVVQRQKGAHAEGLAPGQHEFGYAVHIHDEAIRRCIHYVRIRDQLPLRVPEEQQYGACYPEGEPSAAPPCQQQCDPSGQGREHVLPSLPPTLSGQRPIPVRGPLADVALDRDGSLIEHIA